MQRIASKEKEYKESYIGSVVDSLPGSFLEEKAPEKYDTYGKQSTTIQEERLDTDHIEELVATSKKKNQGLFGGCK